MPDRLKIEAEIAAGEKTMLGDIGSIGDPSLFTCPECHGARWCLGVGGESEVALSPA
jgi:hypothetical protein